MSLPEDLDDLFWQELRQYEEKKNMPYVTSVERIGIKKGIQQGMRQGMQQGMQQGMLEEARDMLLELLQERFGVLSSSTVTQIKAIGQREVLKGLFKQALRVQSVDQFKELLLKVQE
jgi:flagellar biosynthesis/type III secretory pathway protein FliH